MRISFGSVEPSKKAGPVNFTSALTSKSLPFISGRLNGSCTVHFRVRYTQKFLSGKDFEVKAFVKFTGPTFFEGSTEPNEIRIASVVYAEP